MNLLNHDDLGLLHTSLSYIPALLYDPSSELHDNQELFYQQILCLVGGLQVPDLPHTFSEQANLSTPLVKLRFFLDRRSVFDTALQDAP